MTSTGVVAESFPTRQAMKALDTNVLAWFFIDEADDAKAAKRRPAAIAALRERRSSR